MKLRDMLAAAPFSRRTDAKAHSIRRIPMFAECDGRTVEALAAAATELDLDPGTELAVCGRSQREVFLLVEGAAEVVGGEKAPALCQGDTVGALEALAGGSSRFTVRTTSRARALVFSNAEFRQLVAEHPAVASVVLVGVARRHAFVAA
jgi:CRP-like cAMP-binding protein